MNERRAKQRQQAAPLKLSLCRKYWFGLNGRSYSARSRDFSHSGMAMLSPKRFRPGTVLLLTLESADHRLQRLPAELLRCEPAGDHYLCAVHFQFDHLSHPARQAVYTVLQHLQMSLKSTA